MDHALPAGEPIDRSAPLDCTPDLSRTVIDGAFSKGEWDCAAPIAGQRMHLYARLEGHKLHVLVDWIAHTKGKLLPHEFFAVQFSTGGGKQSWVLRGYGDNHIELERHGIALTIGQGVNGFGKSPKLSKPHAIFEFLVGSTDQPVEAGDAHFDLDGPGADCADRKPCADHEPSSPGAQMQPDGSTSPLANDGPTLIALTSGAAVVGSVVAVKAANLGALVGTLNGLGPNKPKVVFWKTNGVAFVAPSKAGLYQLSVTTKAGATSNTLDVPIAEAPAPSGDCAGRDTDRPCDDGNSCTTGDHCMSGKCKGAPVVCNGGGICEESTCVPGTGCVSYLTIGALCYDGIPCTVNDECDASGACVGTPAQCSDSDPCTTDLCVPPQGCVGTALPVGTLCDDGNPCTKSDSCTGKGCAGTAQMPPPPPPCWKTVCDTKTATMVKVPLTGTSCDDDDACTQADLCVKGVCTPGAVECDDGNACTADQCTGPLNGCGHFELAEQTPCDDANKCTVTDKCKTGGLCSGSKLVCDDGDPATTDSCQNQVGCVFTKQ